MSIEILGVVVGAVATLLSTLLGALGRPQKKLVSATIEAPSIYAVQEETRSPRDEAKWSEVIAMLERESGRAAILRWSSTALVFGQFVVGGLLASSFLKKNLGEEIVGILGLIVLAASLSSQHFRPDLAYRVAQKRVKELEKLRRWLSDEIYDIEKSNDLPKISALRRTVSSELDRIEAEESPELRKSQARAKKG